MSAILYSIAFLAGVAIGACIGCVACNEWHRIRGMRRVRGPEWTLWRDYERVFRK